MGQFGIRVLEVLPGPIATDMFANSARVPEAATVPGYEDLADGMHRGRTGIDEFVTPTDVAARAVLTAILTDGGPLRWSCDPLGGQLLTAWQRDPDGTVGASATEPSGL